MVRSFDAPVERVFAAWSKPGQLARWAWGSLGRDVKADVDLRVGGRYEVTTHAGSGETLKFCGEYREVAPGRKLVYTLRWEPLLAYGETEETISVEFTQHNDRTQVTFVHEGVPSDVGRIEHEKGWANTFDALDEVLAASS